MTSLSPCFVISTGVPGDTGHKDWGMRRATELPDLNRFVCIGGLLSVYTSIYRELAEINGPGLLH
jgi:hypothetical protein